MKILPNGIAVIEGDTHASAEVERQGKIIYESWILDLCRLLKPGDVCVDAGALIGGYSRGMKDTVGRSGVVMSFEPNPVAFACLSRNCPDCELFPMGLSDADERREGQFCDNAGATFYTGTDGESCFTPLDRYQLHRLNMLKIDVEGMEMHVLRGARRTITTCRPLIWLEVNHGLLDLYGESFDNIMGLLGSIGYRHSFVQERANSCRVTWPQCDVVFTP